MNSPDYVTQLANAGILDEEQLSPEDREAVNELLNQAEVDTLISIRAKLPSAVLRRDGVYRPSFVPI